MAGGTFGIEIGAGLGVWFGGFGAIQEGIMVGIFGSWLGSKTAETEVEKLQEGRAKP